MSNKIVVTVLTTTQSVIVADVPASLLVTLEGQPSISLPIAGPTFEATFSGIADGTYVGTVQSVRADGSLIGTAISFTVITSDYTAQAIVPTGVSVSVTAL
jgi:hypothetical protein